MAHRGPFETLLTASALALVATFACYGTDVVKPPEGPGTSYPCGVRGVECGGKPLMCCPEKHICGFDGAFSRCAAGYCCYDGDDWPAAAGPDAGPRFSPPRQTPAAR